MQRKKFPYVLIKVIYQDVESVLSNGFTEKKILNLKDVNENIETHPFYVKMDLA